MVDKGGSGIGNLGTIVVQAREQTLPQQTLPPEAGSTDASSGVDLEASERELPVAPDFALHHMGVIVVAILPAFGDLLSLVVAQEVIQVVLDHRSRGGIVSLRELVHVEEILSAEQVVELLVIFSPVDLPVGSKGKDDVRLRTPLDAGSEVEVVLVHMAFLKGMMSLGAVEISISNHSMASVSLSKVRRPFLW